MAEYPPPAIRQLFDAIKKAIPAAELSGIIGDSGHTYGYHRARAVLPSSDYSVQLADDKAGDSWAASALDVKLPPEWMKKATANLRAALKAHDPRVRALREVGGTLNGSVTFCRDRNGSETFGEWDNTHLWHVHLSILRRYANDPAALAGIAATMAGVPMTAAERAKAAGTRLVAAVKPSKAPAWTLPAGHYYGPIAGPAASHGGFYAAERPAIATIQRRLQALGYAPTVAAWADGVYGAPTVQAVKKWQAAHHLATTGTITRAAWPTLFEAGKVTA